MSKEHELAVNFNFADRCSLDCDYCYVDFVREKVSATDCMRIFERICELQPHKVTIAGGDPFSYTFVPTAIDLLWRRVGCVHIDTNAYGLRERDIPVLKEKVALVGLPLDGANEEMQVRMRGRAGHFDLVLKWLDVLNASGVPLKINTVLSKVNATHLQKIAELLSSYELKQWSVFQFWPMERGLANRDLHEFAEESFDKIVNDVRNSMPAMPLKASRMKDRVRGYFFVNHRGAVSTIDQRNNHQYEVVGDLFDTAIVDRWRTAAF